MLGLWGAACKTAEFALAQLVLAVQEFGEEVVGVVNPVKKAADSAAESLARVLVNSPGLATAVVLATQLCFVTAAEYVLGEATGDPRCKVRDIPFKGFGALETHQCDPIVSVLTNLTVLQVVGIAYFQASRKIRSAGSDTLVQVPLECLQNNLRRIVTAIINTAVFDNPPLNPFPANYNGTCQITVNKFIETSTTFDPQRKRHEITEIHPARNIGFFFQNLNPDLCTRIIDLINAEANSCQDSNRVHALQAGKAFLVIAIITGLALVVGAGIFCFLRCKEDRPSFGIGRGSIFQPRVVHRPEEQQQRVAAISLDMYPEDQSQEPAKFTTSTA